MTSPLAPLACTSAMNVSYIKLFFSLGACRRAQPFNARLWTVHRVQGAKVDPTHGVRKRPAPPWGPADRAPRPLLASESPRNAPHRPPDTPRGQVLGAVQRPAPSLPPS